MAAGRSLVIVIVLSACGAHPHDGGAPDGGGDGPAADAFVAADHPPPLQLTNLGGPVLAHPSLVTVSWPGDPLASYVQAFDGWIAGSPYLTTALAEYGISVASHAGSFVFPDAAPATIDALAIGQLLADAVQAGTLLSPTADRLYVVYAPAGTTVTRLGFTSCDAFAGTHLSVPPTGAAPPIVYAIIPRCHAAQYSDQEALTIAASHEIAEAITDPIASDPAWLATDPTVSTGGEIADACNDNPPVIDTYRVNKIYSTIAAKADMRSCLPAPAGPMCGAWATDPKLTIAIGGTAETTLHIYYTAPSRPNDSVLFPLQGLTARLVSPSESYVLVRNGDTLHVTVAVPAGSSTFFDDIIPFSLECGDREYNSWYYLHVQPPQQ